MTNPAQSEAAIRELNAARLRAGVEFQRCTKAKDRIWPLRAQEELVERLEEEAKELRES